MAQPAGSPFDALFPQESSSLRSNQLCFKIIGRNGLILNHDFKEYLVILHVFLLWRKPSIRLKKFATLLPNYWVAETPHALALIRLGRQSAEKERISEIKTTF
ncbi:hypothetical protein ABEI56_08885 [Peribacillus castrilensis]|uniref:hypothetical protein n=1 Tax=Peribacillus castrilensis TaxID=2897690 RepID=UPI003D2D05DC